jgi:hypothetical protein
MKKTIIRTAPQVLSESESGSQASQEALTIQLVSAKLEDLLERSVAMHKGEGSSK